jgi:hypothetical protein
VFSFPHNGLQQPLTAGWLRVVTAEDIISPIMLFQVECRILHWRNKVMKLVSTGQEVCQPNWPFPSSRCHKHSALPYVTEHTNQWCPKQNEPKYLTCSSDKRHVCHCPLSEHIWCRPARSFGSLIYSRGPMTGCHYSDIVVVVVVVVTRDWIGTPDRISAKMI